MGKKFNWVEGQYIIKDFVMILNRYKFLKILITLDYELFFF